MPDKLTKAERAIGLECQASPCALSAHFLWPCGVLLGLQSDYDPRW